MKEWISTQGPLVACYTVYDDFYAYRGGIYSHVTGNVVGGHCVCCVGYNDAEGYWICKNSWGVGFGERGYFRIAYGQCGLDSFMDAAEGVAETGWERDRRVTGLWATNEDRNAWTYVGGSAGARSARRATTYSSTCSRSSSQPRRAPGAWTSTRRTP